MTWEPMVWVHSKQTKRRGSAPISVAVAGAEYGRRNMPPSRGWRHWRSRAPNRQPEPAPPCWPDLMRPRAGPSLKTRLSEWWAAPRRRAQPLAWTLTLAVIVGLLGWNLRLRQQHDTTAEARALLTAEDREVTPLTGSAQARGATARLVLRRDDPRAGLVVSGLPPLPPGRSYQLWFVRPDQTRASGAVFRVDAQGEAVVLVQIPETLGAFRGVGVTEEPAGGSPAPTGRNLLAGALSSLPP